MISLSIIWTAGFAWPQRTLLAVLSWHRIGMKMSHFLVIILHDPKYPASKTNIW